jgi:hypothetical protein
MQSKSWVTYCVFAASIPNTDIPHTPTPESRILVSRRFHDRKYLDIDMSLW